MRRHIQYKSIAVRLGLTLMTGFSYALPSQAQTDASYSDLNPLAIGDLARASRMLGTQNPQGAVDQNSFSAPDFEALSPAMRAHWLAVEGTALFERNDARCIDVLQRLIAEYPDYPESTVAILTIGDWHWYHAEWESALRQYAKPDIKNLPVDQRRLYTYREALAYIKCGVPEKALPLLSTLQGEGEYDLAARYYTAYCHYLQKDYATAYPMMQQIASEIDGFGATAPLSETSKTSKSSGRGRSKAASNPRLRPSKNYVNSDGIEPLYYMAQMEYLNGDYDKVLSRANTLLTKHPVEELIPELNRVAGLSHFKKGEISQARPYLEEYFLTCEAPTSDATYAYGAALYADGELQEAESQFQTLTELNNDLSQGAYLYLGQIAERRGDMNAAAMAFEKAARMQWDANVAETAFYNYIVASSKGGKVPFASTISTLEEFLKSYPSSRYSSAVEESLAAAYFHEQDYAKALASINRVKNPSGQTLATKQKILYQLGISELSAGNSASAATHLREAAEMNGTDKGIVAEAALWLGDALYRSNDYRQASEAYRKALKGNLSTTNAVLARYGLAYSQFQSQQWKGALADFSEVANSSKAPASIKSDALIREADCLHYLGSHSKAATKYAQVIKEGSGDIDYASFRHAIMTGLTGGPEAKIKELDNFLNSRPSSKWTSEVLLEAGNTWAALDRPDKAASYFERLTTQYPKAAQSRKAALSLALAYMKQGAEDKAVSAYKEVIRQWPTSDEAATANEDLRKIMASRGELTQYAAFLSGIKGAPQINPDEMDEISFEAAETAYADDPTATTLLENYISQYPDGRFLANALMDLAEAASDAGNQSKALSYLDQLLWMRDDSEQVPGALYLKASILEDMADREKALAAYQQLEKRGGTDFAPEATAGIMRNTADAAQRAEYARRLLSMGGVDATDAEEARFYEASGILYSGNKDEGLKALDALAAQPSTLAGAMAAVETGEWYLKNGQIKKAVKTLEEFTDAGSPHAYWLAKGFIALADAYHADGRDTLAVEYLKSLRDNYPGTEPDVINAISSKISQYSK